MSNGRPGKMVMMPADKVRRLLDVATAVRKAIDGAEIERAFRVQNQSSYDRGYYQGMVDIAQVVYNALPKDDPDLDEVPF